MSSTTEAIGARDVVARIADEIRAPRRRARAGRATHTDEAAGSYRCFTFDHEDVVVLEGSHLRRRDLRARPETTDFRAQYLHLALDDQPVPGVLHASLTRQGA